MIKDLILKTRSYRRFHQGHAIDMDTLRWFVDAARVGASAGNFQPLKYMLYNTPEDCARIFPTLAWASFLNNWPGPDEGDKPAAYIVIVGDRNVSSFLEYDVGIASQSILLAASERELGGCMIGSIQRDKLRNELNIPEKYEIMLVLALGKPKEKVVLEEIASKGGSEEIKYWRDSEGVHHVPKRRLQDLILESSAKR